MEIETGISLKNSLSLKRPSKFTSNISWRNCTRVIAPTPSPSVYAEGSSTSKGHAAAQNNHPKEEFKVTKIYGFVERTHPLTFVSGCALKKGTRLKENNTAKVIFNFSGQVA